MATRALVFGGGGPVGIAWESGLIAGLAEEGVELAAADFIVGTSAGSFVGAQLPMGRKPASLAAAQMSAQPAPTRRAGRAEAGLKQGRNEAAGLKAFWG